MSNPIVIDPITRIEGHSKITIHLDDDGEVRDAQFHVTQFRGFERIVQGRPIHEMPSMRKSGGEEELRPGMVVTVEPGIYLPGEGGVRIEDDVLITHSGCEVLTNLPKRFEDCHVE